MVIVFDFTAEMKKMKRMLKGMISLAIVLSICVLPVNAAEGPYTVRNTNWGSGDGMILNCYTSGAVSSGTPVSTWTNTGNPDDYKIVSSVHVGTFKIALVARYAHTNTVYLTSHGAKTMCTWQYYNANTDWQAY